VLGGAAAIATVFAARARPRAARALDELGATTAPGPRVALRVSIDLHARLGADADALHATLARARADATARTGVPIAPLAVATDASLAADEVALAIDGTPVAWLRVSRDPLAALADALPAQLAQLAPELLGLDRVAALVERTAGHAPVLVREVVPRAIALPVLADVLRGLAREQVPLDELAPVLEAIALSPAPTGGFTARDVPALVDALRGQLRRQISARWAPRGQLAVYTVDAMIEDSIRTSIDKRDGVAVLALEPAIADDIVAAAKHKLGAKSAVILASADVRRHLRALLEPELPEVAILAAHELAAGTVITTAGRIEV
jgi:type III secretory pathway component EscV